MLIRAFGGWPRWSLPDESLSKQANIYADDPGRAAWDYLARALG
jgi:hypothetical protein